VRLLTWSFSELKSMVAVIMPWIRVCQRDDYIVVSSRATCWRALEYVMFGDGRCQKPACPCMWRRDGDRTWTKGAATSGNGFIWAIDEYIGTILFHLVSSTLPVQYSVQIPFSVTVHCTLLVGKYLMTLIHCARYLY
jgi:hypothetical protein